MSEKVKRWMMVVAVGLSAGVVGKLCMDYYAVKRAEAAAQAVGELLGGGDDDATVERWRAEREAVDRETARMLKEHEARQAARKEKEQSE